MAKEQFFYPQSQSLFKKLERLSQRSGVSRGQAFEDWLTAIVCALAAETKEKEYLTMVERHKKGQHGRRGVDLMPAMFGELVEAMETSDADVLGDLFQGAITYGEKGQFFTPDAVTRLMAEMTVDPNARPEEGRPPLINDPCCGSGRMLLEASRVNPHAELVGQDVDARCANVTAINLGLRGKYGWVVCGNSITGDTQFAYRIGSFFNETPNGPRCGVIRDVPPEQSPVPVLVERMRGKTNGLFEQQCRELQVAESTAATIIEAPSWLARLESTLVALDRDESAVVEERPERIKSEQEAPPARQQELF